MCCGFASGLSKSWWFGQKVSRFKKDKQVRRSICKLLVKKIRLLFYSLVFLLLITEYSSKFFIYARNNWIKMLSWVGQQPALYSFE